MTRREYLLICLAEECAEVAQAASKCLRYGDDEHYEGGASNLERLETEVCDLLTLLDMLGLSPRIGTNVLASEKKRQKVEQQMEIAHQRGIVDEC